MIEIKSHPRYGFLVASDGRVFIPATKFSKEQYNKKNCSRWYYANREKFNEKRRANSKTGV